MIRWGWHRRWRERQFSFRFIHRNFYRRETIFFLVIPLMVDGRIVSEIGVLHRLFGTDPLVWSADKHLLQEIPSFGVQTRYNLHPGSNRWKSFNTESDKRILFRYAINRRKRCRISLGRLRYSGKWLTPGQVFSVGVPRTRNILINWSRMSEPGNRGRPASANSANIQPVDHISILVV